MSRGQVTREDKVYLEKVLYQMKELALKIEKTVDVVSSLVNQQGRIIDRAEDTLRDAIKSMKRSQRLARAAMQMKIRAQQRECLFNVIVTLFLMIGLGIGVNYIWSFYDEDDE